VNGPTDFEGCSNRRGTEDGQTTDTAGRER
jgi:hypothetical protein